MTAVFRKNYIITASYISAPICNIIRCSKCYWEKIYGTEPGTASWFKTELKLNSSVPNPSLDIASRNIIPQEKMVSTSIPSRRATPAAVHPPMIHLDNHILAVDGR